MNRRCLLILAILAGGCASRSSPTTSPEFESGQSPLLYRDPEPVRRQPDTLLAAGNLPLAYLCDNGGNVRIVDATSNALLLQQTIPPQTIIGVSATGILIGRDKVLSARLAPDHRYELWWDGSGR